MYLERRHPRERDAFSACKAEWERLQLASAWARLGSPHASIPCPARDCAASQNTAGENLPSNDNVDSVVLARCDDQAADNGAADPCSPLHEQPGTVLGVCQDACSQKEVQAAVTERWCCASRVSTGELCDQVHTTQARPSAPGRHLVQVIHHGMLLRNNLLHASGMQRTHTRMHNHPCVAVAGLYNNAGGVPARPAAGALRPRQHTCEHEGSVGAEDEVAAALSRSSLHVHHDVTCPVVWPRPGGRCLTLSAVEAGAGELGDGEGGDAQRLAHCRQTGEESQNEWLAGQQQGMTSNAGWHASPGANRG